MPTPMMRMVSSALISPTSVQIFVVPTSTPTTMRSVLTVWLLSHTVYWLYTSTRDSIHRRIVVADINLHRNQPARFQILDDRLVDRDLDVHISTYPAVSAPAPPILVAQAMH